jgi:ketosteroid isomerase-like protein
MRRAAAALVVSSICLAGCGGDAKDQARRAVRDFVKATNEHDAHRYCDQLVTKDFVEGATGATGKQARDVCKRQLRSQRVPPVRLVAIQGTAVHGDRAKVTALLQAGGQSHPQVLPLRKQDGNWRIADSAGN